MATSLTYNIDCMEYMKSMQYRTLAHLIRAGRLYEALPSGTTAKLKETGYIGYTARVVFKEEIKT